MRKYVKKILIVLIGIMLCYLLTASVYASTSSDISLQSMESQTSKFLEMGQQQSSGIQYNEIVKPFTQLGSILTFVGAGVMVAITTYMGVKYITAGPEAQAKLKIQLIGVLVSGIVIFASYGIWKITVQIFGNL